MGRAKLAVGILTASALLAAGLVLYIGQPDDVERALRASGKTDRHFVPEPDTQNWYVIVSATLPPQSLTASPVYLRLAQSGWRPRGNVQSFPDGKRRASLTLAWDASRNIDFIERPDQLQITYLRPPTQAEEAIHAIKSVLHLPD